MIGAEGAFAGREPLEEAFEGAGEADTSTISKTPQYTVTTDHYAPSLSSQQLDSP